MGKETTTVFTVTVINRGNEKTFDDLFKSRFSDTRFNAVKVTSQTVKKASDNPDQIVYSTIHAFLKSAAKDAGLTWTPISSGQIPGHGQFSIKFNKNSVWQDGEPNSWDVYVNNYLAEFKFKTKEYTDFKLVIKISDPNHGISTVEEVDNRSLAHPNLQTALVELFKEMDTGYQNGRNTKARLQQD